MKITVELWNELYPIGQRVCYYSILNSNSTPCGVFSPEMIGQNERLYDFIMNELEYRNITFEKITEFKE